MLKVFMFNSKKDWTSKTATVIAKTKEQAIRKICDATESDANDWQCVASGEANSTGVIGLFTDYLGV